LRRYPNPRRLGVGLTIVGRHLISLEPPATAADVWRPAARAAFARPLLAFAPLNIPEQHVEGVAAATPAPARFLRASRNSPSALVGGGSPISQAALPQSISIVTLQPMPYDATSTRYLLYCLVTSLSNFLYPFGCLKAIAAHCSAWDTSLLWASPLRSLCP
jgi:hypothetical protein